MSMVKIVSPGGWDFDRPVAVQVKLASGGLTGEDRRTFFKTAGHVFAPIIDGLKVARDETPVHLIAMGATEGYGCFPAGTAIRMADGTRKAIEKIALGDRVVTHTGDVGEVITLYNRPYAGGMCRLDVAGMKDAVACTENHKFWVIPASQVACRVDDAKQCKPSTCQNNALCKKMACSRSHVRYFPEWVRADELTPGDYVLVPVPDRSVGVQTWRWSPALAKIIGYFVAEGSYEKRKGGKGLSALRFDFNLYEATTLGRDLAACVAALATEYAGLRLAGPYFSQEGGTATYVLRGDKLAERVKRCVGEYAGGKFLGGEIAFQSPETLRHFFAGWLDGDGTIPAYVRPSGYEEHRYTIYTKSESLALDAQWLLGRLGIAAAVCPVRGDATIAGYHVSFTNAAGDVFAGAAFKHRRVPAAQEKEHTFVWNGYVCRPVRSIIKYDASLPVFNFEVEGDHSYTVGNGIAVKNCNRNGDGFKEATCKKYVKTFEKLARYYRNHKNKDPKKSYGYIKAAAYNDAMRRIELLCMLNATKEAAERNGGLVADLELEKLAKGEDLSVSMACTVTHDSCSSCGHRARTRDEYCTADSCVGPKGEKRGGCRHNLTKVGSDGHILHVDNPDPQWFDISTVFRPADRIAYGAGADYLAKAASDGVFVPGAELAEVLGVTAPLAVLTAGYDLIPDAHMRAQVKLAAGLATLEAYDCLDDGLRRACDPRVSTPATADQLATLGRPSTGKAASGLAALADAGVVLPLRDFAAWTGKEAHAADAAMLLPEAFTRLLADPRLEQKIAANRWTPGSHGSFAQTIAADALAAECGLTADAALDRAMRSGIRQLDLPKQASDAAERTMGAAAAVPGVAALAEDYTLYKLAALYRIAACHRDFTLTARLAIGQNRTV